jgi:hypothetical protein
MPRPLRLVLPRFADDVDYVVISNSDSLGVFFLERDVPVFVTEPVLEQLMIRMEMLMSLSVAYDDEDEFSAEISKADPERLRRNVNLVRFREDCSFNETTMTVHPAGTYIGWCNLSFELEDGKTLSYISSLSGRKRFAVPAMELRTNYSIINIEREIPAENHAGEFSTHIEKLESKVLIIPVDMATIFPEVITHVLSLLQRHRELPVHIISSVFGRLVTAVNMSNEWLSDAFAALQDPFPVRAYRNLTVHRDFSELVRIHTPSVVFCDVAEFILLKHPLLENQEVVAINNSRLDADFHYSLKLEMDKEEISRSIVDQIISDPLLDTYLYLDTSSRHSYVLIDGKNAQVHKNVVYLNGRLKPSDKHVLRRKQLAFVSEENRLSELFGKSRFFCRDGWFYFPEHNLRVFIGEKKVRICKTGGDADVKKATDHRAQDSCSSLCGE